jgi:hypothetical protein
MTTTRKAILCIMTATALTACGVKPGNVKPPSGSEDLYPATYPHPGASQNAYDLEMARIQGKRAEAERAAKAAEEADRNKPDWSVR